MEIRDFERCDYGEISKIYQQGILSDCANFATKSPNYHNWNKGHLNSPRLVAVENGKVIGFAALSFSFPKKREYYKGVAELTIYVANGHKQKGVGKALVEKMIMEAKKRGIWTIESLIFTINKPSMILHEKCGFRLVGVREKFGVTAKGEWRDVAIYEYRIGK